MKTLGRIIIILAAFVIVMGITYTTVSASGSSSSSAPAFERGSEGLAPNGVRPEFQGENQNGGGWMFGLMKNIVIVAVIVMIIVFPKNLLQQKRRAVPVRIK